MKFHFIKGIIFASALLNYGFMLTDGLKAIITGDYFRPESGEYAGQLGPWSIIVDNVGIDPEGILMMYIFVTWGVIGLFAGAFFLIRPRKTWKTLFIVSISSLWYLVPGTMLSLVQIVLLLIIRKYLRAS